MLPRIAITCDVGLGMRPRGDGRLLTSNPDLPVMIGTAGGLPLLVPPLAGACGADAAAIGALLDAVDGLVLSGGDDLHSENWNEALHPAAILMDEARARAELALAREALARGIPVLGICGGMQLLNVVAGGSLHQHLPDLAATRPAPLDPLHAQGRDLPGVHQVRVEAGSRLESILRARELATNSRHHQAVHRPGRGVRLTAFASDGVVEGLELEGAAFALGVQWHPEEHVAEERHALLFRGLVEAAGRTAAHRRRSGASRLNLGSTPS